MKACDGLGAKAWMRRTLEMLVTVIATITKSTVHTGRSKGTQSHRVQNLKGIIGEHRAQLKTLRKQMQGREGAVLQPGFSKGLQVRANITTFTWRDFSKIYCE